MLSTNHQYGSLNKANDTVFVNMAGYLAVGIQVSGTWVGTITPEGSIDGTNWFTIDMIPIPTTTAVTTATANGQWTCKYAGLKTFRLRMGSYTSGSAQVTLRATETG